MHLGALPLYRADVATTSIAMWRLLWLLTLAASASASVASLNDCILVSHPWTVAGSREKVLYDAMMASSSKECHANARKVACLVREANHHQVAENDMLCLLECNAWLSEVCPDIMLFASSCPVVAHSECAARASAVLTSMLN